MQETKHYVYIYQYIYITNKTQTKPNQTTKTHKQYATTHNNNTQNKIAKQYQKHDIHIYIGGKSTITKHKNRMQKCNS